jgi:uncharacterized protein YabE (DUF348 family)
MNIVVDAITHQNETVIYQHSKDVFVTSDGGFMTIWGDGDKIRCIFVHRLNQLPAYEQTLVAKNMIDTYILG